jgi:hypothetical protein
VLLSGSAVGIAIGYELVDGGSEFESRQGEEFSLFYIFQTDSGAHPPSYAMGYICLHGEVLS